jgi:hypothetical protein
VAWFSVRAEFHPIGEQLTVRKEHDFPPLEEFDSGHRSQQGGDLHGCRDHILPRHPSVRLEEVAGDPRAALDSFFHVQGTWHLSGSLELAIQAMNLNEVLQRRVLPQFGVSRVAPDDHVAVED